MVQAVSRRPFMAEVRDNPRGFVAENVVLEQVFFSVLRGFPVSIIPPCFPLSYVIWGISNGFIGSRSSETVSPHRHKELMKI
jgi:hypothetical protein